MKTGNRTIGASRSGWMLGFCLVASMSVPMTLAQELEQRGSTEAAAAFVERVDGLIDDMPVERETFDVRINRCADPQGGMSDDIYSVWIGARLVTREAHHADDVIATQAQSWRAMGWEVTRDRKLPNGGANLAASDPQTGDSYSLDSGFAPEPARFVVGYFTTRCFIDPSGSAPFGPMSVD